MSDKIYELIKQSEVSISHPKCFTGYIDINKFAELIVRECMEVAGASYTSTPEDCVYYVDLAVNRIAEHFGVKE